MKECRIYGALKEHTHSVKSFHVPGHKAARSFKAMFPMADMDVTELSYSGNLSGPSGVIAEAEKDIAAILGAKYSILLTDGSTSGIMVMMFAASRRGKKIIVPRNSHESVWNACRLLGLEPVVVQGEDREGIMQQPAPELVERLTREDASIAGMIAVSPDYYGNIAPLKEYADIMRKYGRLLLVDEAHGAYLAFEEGQKNYAGKYADMWTDGAHKTLPTLTQGAILSLKDDSLLPVVEEALGIFRTTSPSYPIMASIEYGVKYIADNPGLARQARKAAEDFRADGRVKTYANEDWTKLVADCGAHGVSADRAAEALEKRDIYPELSDGRHLIFYLSPLVTEKDLTKLKSALEKVLSNSKLQGTYEERPAMKAAPRTYSFQYAVKHESEFIPLSKAAGRMAACNAGIMPPCIPLIVAGDIITKQHIDMLSKASGVFGVTNGCIEVVKN